MAVSSFYDAGLIKQLAVNVFYGWGYNFYRQENQLRADDLLVRGKVGGLLGQARASIEAAEADYRRQYLPPPSRQAPVPPAGAIADAQALERLSRALGALEGQIRAQPAPENDRISERFRQEAPTLQALLDCDRQLAGQAELLRSLVEHKDGAWLLANQTPIQEGLHAIEQTLHARQHVLAV